ncbi:hypothetical protein V2J09_007149 [Rumex salicifolius]
MLKSIGSFNSNLNMLLVLCFHLISTVGFATTTTTATGGVGCPASNDVSLSIGGIFNGGSRMGKEQEVAMKMAVEDFSNEQAVKECSNHYKLQLRLVDSNGSSARAISAAMKLIDVVKVGSLLGRLEFPQATMISEIDEKSTKIPLILLNPTALTPPLVQSQSQNVIQMSDDITLQAQCIASIVGYFHWSKVTIIYEQGAYTLNSGIITILSDALKSVEATVDQYKAFPPPKSSSLDAENAIEMGLSELKTSSNRVFIVVQSSLELATDIFLKAKQMEMMREGYIWIVSDEIASLLHSLNSSVIESMQGVIGYKTTFNDTSQTFKKFKQKFQQNYGALYPEEEDYTPSIFAIRAYDAIWAILNSLKKNQEEDTLLQNILSSNTTGLTGIISFQNGILSTPSTFQIINIIGKSYNELAYWSKTTGFSKEIGSSIHKKVKLEPIYWPGGHQKVPPGWDLGGRKEVLKIGVPAEGAFHQFINVSHDPELNKTVISGFSVEVFKAALEYLPYQLSYELVPFYDDYDKLVQQIRLKDQKKRFDGAVGDTNILADRCEWADFTQPYVKSGLALVVPVKPDRTKETWMFMEVFELKMWLLIPSTSLFIGFVVWLIEHQDHNPEFDQRSLSEQLGTILWFSFAVLFFAQKESLKSNLSKLVLAPWMFLILMLTANFTATLTSKLTVAQLQPSASIESLRRDDAIIGCNRNSFTCKYLIDVLHIKPKNIRQIRSIDDYPRAFQRGEIKAAAFVTEHANVFLKKYCKGFSLSGATYTFGGLGFAFPKGSPLTGDVSRAILRAIESGRVGDLEKDMLTHCKCSSEDDVKNDVSGLGFRPFSGLFYISGGIATIVFLITMIPQMKRVVSFMAEALSKKKICTETCPKDKASDETKEIPTASSSN